MLLAAAAWADLSMRHREFVRGRKLWWALAIAVNFVGPLSYFRCVKKSVRMSDLSKNPAVGTGWRAGDMATTVTARELGSVG